MTTKAGLLLINSVLPLLAGAIAKGAVKPVGSEDREELTADCGALAAAMLDAAERAGKPTARGPCKNRLVTLGAGDRCKRVPPSPRLRRTGG